MKRGTPDHPKMLDLAAKLDVPIWGAVGIVEMLWHWTARYAPEGNVGKHSNNSIARGIGWTNDPQTLIDALIATRWIDVLEGVGIYVHDWDQHCEDAVHQFLARNIRYFANGVMPKLTGLNKQDRPEVVLKYKDKPFKPLQNMDICAHKNPTDGAHVPLAVAVAVASAVAISLPQRVEGKSETLNEAQTGETSTPNPVHMLQHTEVEPPHITMRTSSPDDDLIAEAQCQSTPNRSSSQPVVTSTPDSLNLSSQSTQSTAITLETENGMAGPTSMTSTMFPGLAKASKADIEAVYWAYPRHIDKFDAVKAIEKALKNTPYQDLIKATRAFAESPAGKKGNYTPYPASWFNAGGYLTDPDEWHRTPATNTPVRDQRSASIASIGTKAVDAQLAPVGPRLPYAVAKAREWGVTIREFFDKSDPTGLATFQTKYPEYNIDEK